jgi:hypothetical protein
MKVAPGVETAFSSLSRTLHAMAQQTEAACLLETGAMYGKRLLLRPDSGDPIFAGFRPGVFSLYFGDAPIAHFDREGRWQRAFLAGTHYLKGLDGTVQAIDRVREEASLVLKRRTLSYAEATDLDAQIRALALGALDEFNAGRLARQTPPAPTSVVSDDELRDTLEQVAGWDAAAWFAHRERHVATYGPLPILPPDAQAAVVLQATLGHVGGIAFGLGAAADHAVRTPEEFADHARAVRRLLGGRLLQSRTAFLAGADALRQVPETVAAYFEAVAAAFPIDAERVRRRGRNAPDADAHVEGIDAFLDDFTAPPAGWPDWRALCDRHLRRVTLGVESGAPEVRTLYRKHWKNDDLHALVTHLKDAGLGVGLMVLVDAGGIEHAGRHLSATAELVGTLPLGAGDLVSLLDASEVCDPALGPEETGFTPLTGAPWDGQQAELRQLLLPLRSERGVKVAPCSLEKQPW